MSLEIVRKIAEEAGVSTNTVHRVLAKGIKDSRPSIVKRANLIMRAAEKYNYRPNAAAKSLRNGRSDNMGLILGPNSYRSNISNELMQGMLSALEALKIRLVAGRISENAFENNDEFPKMLSEWTCDGLLVNYQSATPGWLSEIIEKLALPTVWINERKDFDCVRPDDLGAAERLTRKLIAKGRRRIVYADFNWERAGSVPHYSKLDRRAGYEKAMDEAGLKSRFVSDEGCVEQRDKQLERTLELFKSPSPPDALICYGTEWRFVELAAAEAGLRAQRDFDLASFCSRSESSLFWPVRCCVVPHYEMGFEAVKMLKAKLDAPGVKMPVKIAPFEEPEIA